VPRVSARPCWSASRHERAGGACTPRAPELGNDRSVSSFILGCAAGGHIRAVFHVFFEHMNVMEELLG